MLLSESVSSSEVTGLELLAEALPLWHRSCTEGEQFIHAEDIH
jgi:hypothetical protein